MMLLTMSLSLIPISPAFIENVVVRIILAISAVFSFWLVGFKIPTNKSLKNESIKK